MSKRKDSKKNVRDEDRILALYSDALASGKKASINKYMKKFKGNKKQLTELLNLIRLLDEAFK